MTTDMFQASYLQESLYESAKDGQSAVNVGVVLELRGPLDVPRLLAAIGALARRHEALRTTLTSVDGMVLQVVGPAAEVPATVLDASAEDDPVAEAMWLISDHVRRPFALEGAALYRVIVIRCGPARHFLAISLHHAIMDGWSVGLLTTELRACYGAGGAARLPEPGLQLADYAAFERQPADPAALDGWRERLRGYTTRVAIPGVTGPGTEQLALGCELPGDDPAASAGTDALARRLRVPAVAVFAAAVAASLREYAGSGLVIGLVRANREREELRNVVGYLADVAPLAIDLSGDPDFATLVGRAADALAYTRDHPLPLAALARLLPSRGGPGPLFDVCLNYLPGAHGQASGDLLMTSVDVKATGPVGARWWAGTALIDYVLRSAVPGQLTGCVRADINTLPAGLVADLADRFWAALVRGTREPGLPISELAPAPAVTWRNTVPWNTTAPWNTTVPYNTTVPGATR